MASNTKLSDKGTKFVKFRGNINRGTSFPTDTNPGEIFHNTGDGKVYINETGNVWRVLSVLTTTTSTSTSTTTTSTSTT